ncbi:MAG: helix-turn-helix transcriptional regulator [Clostridia bacterium]|nr:helix-turn-helix transcriptional regulator [Clostridia bacterium]
MRSIEQNVSPASEYYIHVPGRTAQELFLYPLQCGLFTYEPGYTLTRQSFDSFLIMYVQRGEMLLSLPHITQRIPEGHFAFLDCYRTHGYSAPDGAECLWLHFDGTSARYYFDAISERLGSVFFMSEPAHVLRILRAILRIFSENLPAEDALLHRHLTDLLTEFLLVRPSSQHPLTPAQIASAAAGFIGEHLSEDLSLQRIADTAGLSPFYFSRLFLRETGYTPHEYLIRCRMQSARYLLRCTRLSLREICESTGFSSESAFCHAFRKHHGMTPGAFRSGAGEADTEA